MEARIVKSRKEILLRTLLVFVFLPCFLSETAWSETYPYVLEWGFAGAHGVAIDTSGNVFVTSYDNNIITKFNSNGNSIATWGSSGTGDGQFNCPVGVAVDPSGKFFVADRFNYRIQKFDSDGTFMTKWGSFGTGDGQFSGLAGVALDTYGNVYVADNGRIQKFDSDGTFIAKWGSFGTGDGQFYGGPNGVAVDTSGNVFATESYWHPMVQISRIQKFDSNGNFITKWGAYGTGDGQFSRADGVAVDTSGYVFVSDNHRIQKFSSDGNYLTQWGSLGTGDGLFSGPTGVAVDTSGNVYVADNGNDRVQKFTPVFNLTVTTPVNGTVRSLPSGIDCGSNCSQTFDDGTVVTLKAIPDSGSYFTGWSGHECDENVSLTCKVKINAIKTVTANFSSTPPISGTWAKTFGGALNDEAGYIYQTSDGGFIVSARTSSFGAGSADSWIIKLSKDGFVEWQKTYGRTSSYDSPEEIVQTSDGGYIFSGTSYDELWLMKLDSLGTSLWEKTYGGLTPLLANIGYAVQETNDGGYIITGQTDSFTTGQADVWVLKTDSLGNVVWQNTYGGLLGPDAGASVKQTRDGGYILAGSSYPPTGGGIGISDALVMKVKHYRLEADSLKPKTTKVVSGGYGEVVIMGTLF